MELHREPDPKKARSLGSLRRDDNEIKISWVDSLEYFPFGVLFARERATHTAPSACQPTEGFARLLLTHLWRITTDFSSRIGHRSTVPCRCKRMQDLDSLEYFPFGVLFAHERATRTAPSACQSTGGFARLLSPVHGALLLISSSRIGHRSTISYR